MNELDNFEYFKENSQWFMIRRKLLPKLIVCMIFAIFFSLIYSILNMPSHLKNGVMSDILRVEKESKDRELLLKNDILELKNNIMPSAFKGVAKHVHSPKR